MPMTITHVIPYMHPNAGGPPVVVDRLCRRLVDRGWTVRVITTDGMAEAGDDRWQAQYRDRYALDVYRTKRRNGYAYSSELWNALSVAVKGSDLVHLHTLWTYPTFAAARVCRALKVPYVVMPHGMLDPNSLRRKWLKKWVYGQLFEWPNIRAARSMIYTHSEEQRLAEKAVSRLPAGAIVPLGADEPPCELRNVQAERFLEKFPQLIGRDIVLFFGRLHPKKGLDLLIPAFADIARANPNARLLLVGPGEDAYVRSLHESISRLQMQDKVTFTGPLSGDEKWQALAASTVFVLPSYQENFALTVVEAMRAGLPVVLSRRVNIWKDVVQADAGLDCDLSPSSVASRVLSLLNDRSRREASALHGSQLVEEKFSWERCADATEAAYRELLCGGVTAGT